MTPYHPQTPWPAINLPTHYDGMPFPTGPAAWLAKGAKALRIVEAGGIVLLNGAYGTGKTWMATLLARQVTPLLKNAYFPAYPPLPDHRRPIVYWHAKELMDRMKANYGTNANVALMDEMREASILILDELSKAVKSPHDCEVLATIIDRRYRDNRPVILCANFDIGRLDHVLDGSTIDRIREVGGIMSFDWPGFRGNASVMAAESEHRHTKNL